MNLPYLIKKFILPKTYSRAEGLLYWREKFFLILCFTFLIIGLLAYIPSLVASISVRLWPVAVIDTIAYLMVVIIFFNNQIGLKMRIYLLLSLVYLLSIILLVFLGPHGAGFIWLILVPVLAALLLGTREAIKSNIIIILTLIVLGFLIFHKVEGLNLTHYNLTSWIVISLNYILISIVISVPFSVLLQALDNSLRNEKNFKDALEEQNAKLKMEKESAESADRHKSVYIANMAHEIRTPMNGILGFSCLLADDGLNRDQQLRYTKIIEQRAEYLLRLINNIIDLSKIEAGQFQMDYGVVNINKLLNDVYEMFISQLKSSGKNIEIVLDIEKNINHTIISDSTKIQQVLINLISNAIKFTEKGEVRFGYKVKNNFLNFYIKDSGIGIPEKDKNIIFERYRRSDNSNLKRKTEGTGLGLSITKGLVNLMGGDIWFESEDGKGSTFYFSIPYKKVDHIEENIVKTEVEMTTSWKEKTILIVEDDPVSTELLREVLSETDAKLEYAGDGSTAVKICRNKKIDIILMDIQLPGMNGQTALHEIKKHNKQIIIIAQTAFAMSGDKEKYIAQGFDDYISKPIYPNILLELLTKYL